jgi:hypothetical protein
MYQTVNYKAMVLLFLFYTKHCTLKLFHSDRVKNENLLAALFLIVTYYSKIFNYSLINTIFSVVTHVKNKQNHKKNVLFKLQTLKAKH